MLVPTEELQYRRKTVIVGECLRKVRFQSFLNLITVANKRINLDILDLNVLELSGADEQINQNGFIKTLLEANHAQTTDQIFKYRLPLSSEDWLKYIEEALSKKNYNFVNSLLHLIDQDKVELLFKDR